MHVPGGHSKYAKECSRVKNKVQDFVECIDKEFIQLNSVTFGALKIDHIYIYIYIYFLTHRVVRYWSNLFKKSVNAPYMEMFKAKLHGALGSLI